MADPLAVIIDLEARWRSLTDVEQHRAWVLLDDASRKLRRRALRAGVDLDAQIAAGLLDAEDAAAVVVSMVKRVLISGDADGIEQRSQTAGPFTVSASYSNPLGNLYVTADDLAYLGIGGRKRAFVVDLGPDVLPASFYVP